MFGPDRIELTANVVAAIIPEKDPSTLLETLLDSLTIRIGWLGGRRYILNTPVAHKPLAAACQQAKSFSLNELIAISGSVFHHSPYVRNENGLTNSESNIASKIKKLNNNGNELLEKSSRFIQCLTAVRRLFSSLSRSTALKLFAPKLTWYE